LTRAYLALGSNLGDRLAYLQGAVDGLARADGITMVGVSRVYETAPLGGPDQGAYLNAVVAVDTELAPRALLAFVQTLESDARRVRSERFGPRTLDVDILLYDELELDTPELTIPHPRMWERAFVLVPLHDLAPERARAMVASEDVREAPVTLTLPST